MATPDASLSRALDYADRWLAYRCWRLRIPGLQAAVRVGGALRLDTAHGLADARTREPLTPRHRFRIASHSKSLAALTVLRLVEDGRLRLDDAVQEHVPTLRDRDAGALLVRELLSHGSGSVRDGDDVAFWHLQAPFPDAEQPLGDRGRRSRSGARQHRVQVLEHRLRTARDRRRSGHGRRLR